MINLESSHDEKDIKSIELSSTVLKTLANEPIESPLVPDQRLEPFYVSLFINGFKLNNCIIDSRAFDNIMPSTVAKALGLSLTKTFGKCYSMDSKQIPLLCQIKDAQVSLAVHPNKRVKLTILVVDIPTSYGMLLSRTFCKDLGGEIKMDWSEAIISIGKQKFALQPEPKSKYTVFPSDDPKSQILYQECDFGNYLLFSDDKKGTPEDVVDPTADLWEMEFDGSCASAGSGVGVVLISPQGGKIPFSFKLEFKNTNNIAKYEALLLGIEQARKRGIRLLNAKGNA